MPAKRQAEEGTEPRRSGRTKPASETAETKATTTVQSKAKPASKAKKPTSAAAKATKEAAPKEETAAAPAENGDKEDDKEEVAAPEPKKAKTGGSALSVGDQVPGDITLKNEDGEDVTIGSIFEKQGVAIFSYPKANTPGCTTQACGFRDLHEEISKTGYGVYGLSSDPPKSQLNWKTKHSFPYHLLSDPDKKLLKQLGATESVKRCSWVIEKGGKLLSANLGVKPADDPKNTLAFIKSL